MEISHRTFFKYQGDKVETHQETRPAPLEPVGTVEEAVIAKLRSLPPEKRQEVLDFVEFLAQRALPKQPRRSLEGMFADLGVHITEEDIAEARREMWGNFPREDI
jgi:Protein of unknown function (DUF2281)